MPDVVWLHASSNPLASGELRRLGLPALTMESHEWRCRFLAADGLGERESADVVIVPVAALHALPAFAHAKPPKVVAEVDDLALANDAAALDLLGALAGRLDAIAARGALAAERLAALKLRLPVWTIPDPADTPAELRATAIRFDKPWVEAPPAPASAAAWFCEAGDLVSAAEIEAVARLDEDALIYAPAEAVEWLRQAGGLADLAVASAYFPGGPDRSLTPDDGRASQSRRVRKASRLGMAAASSGDPAHDPKAVALAWRAALGSLLGRRVLGGRKTVLVFLDLIQDLDLAWPVIEDLAGRRDLEIRIAVSDWLEQRSPRVQQQLSDAGLDFELVDRRDVVLGRAPDLGGVDAVVAVVETSEPAHARAHALFGRARSKGLPTFSLQHGLENVGLNYFEDGETPRMLSDHLFAWFGRKHTPAETPNDLRPRLVHVGRPSQRARANDIRSVLSGFDRVAAVFENLHWERYDEAYRERFLDDCSEFALAFPRTAVLIKPHHAGMWTVKNRALFPQWSANLIMADPADSFWEPFTAPSLIEAADLVITTPSTVALDAASAGRPVAVAAYGMELRAFAPLTLLNAAEDWVEFARSADRGVGARLRAAFVSRSVTPGRAETAAADYIEAVVRDRSPPSAA